MADLDATVVERVARALLAENRPDYTATQLDHGWTQYRFAARAAIEAMPARRASREPPCPECGQPYIPTKDRSDG